MLNMKLKVFLLKKSYLFLIYNFYLISGESKKLNFKIPSIDFSTPKNPDEELQKLKKIRLQKVLCATKKCNYASNTCYIEIFNINNSKKRLEIRNHNPFCRFFSINYV